MHRFRRILYVVGPAGPGSHRAGLRRAARLAESNRGELTVASVLEAEPEEWLRSMGSEVRDIRRRIEATHESRLRELADPVRAEGVEPELKILRGRPFVAVAREVMEHGHDLVIKVAEGRAEGLRGRLFGSTDHHLLRKCPSAVWLLPPGSAEGVRSVLAAVDVGWEESDELNGRIVRLASTLAVGEGASLHVVHAWSLYGEKVLRSPGRGIDPERLRRLLVETRQERGRRLRALVGREAVAGSEPRSHLVKAKPTVAIRQVAERVGADVVVMGTLTRAAMTGLLIGTTAEGVLDEIRCAALTVKPDGFRTPLRLEELAAETGAETVEAR